MTSNILFIFNAMKRIALVTGANRGIGLEISRQLVNKGYFVYQGARNLDSVPDLSEKGEAVPVELDVTDSVSIEAVMKIIKKDQKKLDVLINNAGISKSSKGVVDVTYEEYEEVMLTNYFGPLKMIQLAYPLLKKSSDARIINVSSRMGSWKSLKFGYAPYRQSKVSLNALTVQLANELEQDNIGVCAVCPGWVRTEMGGASAERDVTEGADTIVWLADNKSFVTGKFYADREIIDW